MKKEGVLFCEYCLLSDSQSNNSDNYKYKFKSDNEFIEHLMNYHLTKKIIQFRRFYICWLVNYLFLCLNVVFFERIHVYL